VSFILDALRKSEAERQRQSGTGLVDAGYRRPTRRHGAWLPVVAIALVANLAAVVYFGYFGNGTQREPVAPAAAAVPTTPAQPAVPGPPPAVAAAVVQPAPRAPSADDAYAATADLPALEPAPVETLPAPAAPASSGPPVPGSLGQVAGAPGGIVQDLPTADELMQSGSIPQQPLHLDIHVFSTVPAERFVFINMRKLVEGAELTPGGARIEEITRDGVVLSEAGHRFLLTRD